MEIRESQKGLKETFSDNVKRIRRWYIATGNATTPWSCNLWEFILFVMKLCIGVSSLIIILLIIIVT